MKVVTAAQMREIETQAINQKGIPALLLMENAGIKTAARCMGLLRKNVPKGCQKFNPALVTIVCGSGGNGGDGFVVARHLRALDMDIRVLLANDPDRLKNDALTNFEIIRRMGVPITQLRDGRLTEAIPLLEGAALVVDALFGTGIGREISGHHANIINAMNKHAKLILSVDMPSGVCPDTGRVLGNAVKAHATVTFGFMKVGLLLYPGVEHAGKVFVEQIGIPLSADRFFAESLSDDDIFALLPERPPRIHKGSFKRVFVIAGSDAMPGAAVLCVRAAYAAGAGYVVACATKHVAAVLHALVPEAVTVPLNGADGRLSFEDYKGSVFREVLQSAGIILMGPGLGRGDQTSGLVRAILEEASVPMVLDADALTLAAASTDGSVFKRIKAPCVVTPHPGEMSALTGLPVAKIVSDLPGTAKRFACENDVTVLLKDARTVIAEPSGRLSINASGCPAMAKAGSGDALAGIIAALASQGKDLYDAAVLGAYLHGKAGEAAAKDQSPYSVSASGLIDYLPRILCKQKNDDSG